MRTSKSSTAWKKRAALLLTVTALCTASSPFTSFAADPVTASEVNISVKGGTRGLTASGITPGHVYAGASGWSEGAAGDTNSVAIGGGQVGSMSSSASVRGQNSVAVGAGASIDVSSSQDAFNYANATAIGTSSSVSAMQGTAVGYKSKVTGAQGTAMGEQSTAEAAGAATFGEGSHAKAKKSTALGTGANVGDGANNSVALGADSTVFNSDLTSTDKNGVVSLGSGNAERRIIHVADGVNNTDAATVGQFKNYIHTINGRSVVDASDPSTAIGENSAVAGGSDNAASGDYAAIGGGNTNRAAGQLSTIAGGFVNKASGDYAAIGGGQYNTASGENATIGGGTGNTAYGNGSTIAGGNNNQAGGLNSSVLGGFQNAAIGESSFAAGNNNVATGKNAGALGNGSYAAGANSLAIGNEAYAGEDNTISFGHKKGDPNASSLIISQKLDDDGNPVLDENGDPVTEVMAGDTYQTDSFSRLTNIANGTDAHDAATVGQMTTAVANATKNVDDITMNTTDALNKKSETRSFKQAGLVPGKSNSSYSTAIGNTGFGDPSIGKNSAMSVAIGDVSQVGDNAERSTAIGYNSNIAAGAEHSVAIGESTSVTKKESVAVGEKATVQTQNAIAIGTGAKIASGAVNSIAIGGQYAYDEEGGLGGGSDYLVTRNAKNSTVIGTAGLSQSEGGVALGKGARVTYDADNSAALGTDSIVSDNDILQNDSKGVVSFGSSDTNEGFTRRLINVSDGVNNTDAATVGQLNKAVASATQNVDDVTMNTTDALNGSTETRSFKAAGLVPGKSNSSYSTAIGNTGFGDPSIGTNSDMSVAIVPLSGPQR